MQNGAMGGQFVKNFVMDAKNDPRVVMDLSMLKNGGWNRLRPISQIFFEEFVDKNEPWLLIGIPSRDPFLVTQYLERHSESSDQHMKKLMPLRQGLLEENHGRINYLFRERTCMQMECAEDAVRVE